MRSVWEAFKRFWVEEEIPRWLGMSLLAGLLFGLGAVTLVAQRQMEALAVRAAIAHGDHSMSLLAKLVGQDGDVAPGRVPALLRDFARRLRCDRLYVVDEADLIVASENREDLGRPALPPPAVVHDGMTGDSEVAREIGGFDVVADERGVIRRYYRMPIPSDDGARRVLVGVIRWDAATVGPSGEAWFGMTVLATVGALGVTYHLMRRHFRGVACIADNLVRHADHLEQELGSLRVSDSLGAVAASWNRLIDLAETFRTEAGRSTAASELRHVLERSSDAELADAMDAVPDGLLVIGDEGRLVRCNAAAARLMRWKQDEASGQPLAELETAVAGKAILEIVGHARSAGGGYHAHADRVEHGGSHYRVRVIPQHDNRRHGGCVVVITDISQQTRADHAREEFVSQVTHELRTPLTNIQAYTETLSSGMFDDPKVVTECYNVINKETRRLSRLVEDILSASQLEVGSIRILFDDVDIRLLIQEAVRDVRAVADEKSIDLQAVLPAKMGPIPGDRDKLAVVLNNLLGNAVKYTPRAGEIRIGCQTTDEHVLLTVKDTGIGIAESEQSYVFEKFHRSKDPAVQCEPGTGIGLTTAREIVQRHGGDIELMSEKGKGSTFVVKLPHTAGAAKTAGRLRG